MDTSYKNNNTIDCKKKEHNPLILFRILVINFIILSITSTSISTHAQQDTSASIWIERIRQINLEKDIIESSLARTQTQVKELTSELENLQNEYQQLLDAATTARSDFEARIGELEEEIRLSSEAASDNRALAESTRERERLTQRLAQTEQDLRASGETVETLTTQRDALLRDLDELRDLSETQQAESQELNSTVDALRNRVREQEADIAALRQQRDTAIERRDAAINQEAELRDQNSTLSERIEEYQDRLAAPTESPQIELIRNPGPICPYAGGPWVLASPGRYQINPEIATLAGNPEVKSGTLDGGRCIAATPVTIGLFRDFFETLDANEREELGLAVIEDRILDQANTETALDGVSWVAASRFVDWLRTSREVRDASLPDVTLAMLLQSGDRARNQLEIPLAFEWLQTQCPPGTGTFAVSFDDGAISEGSATRCFPEAAQYRTLGFRIVARARGSN